MEMRRLWPMLLINTSALSDTYQKAMHAYNCDGDEYGTVPAQLPVIKQNNSFTSILQGFAALVTHRESLMAIMIDRLLSNASRHDQFFFAIGYSESI
jgi:hypothetical protein